MSGAFTVGNPVFLAVPPENAFQEFASLCAGDFACAGFDQFMTLIDIEATTQARLGRRVLCVPMHVADFRKWLAGRKGSHDLWLAYTTERASTCREWPPAKRMYFPLAGEPGAWDQPDTSD